MSTLQRFELLFDVCMAGLLAYVLLSWLFAFTIDTVFMGMDKPCRSLW